MNSVHFSQMKGLCPSELSKDFKFMTCNDLQYRHTIYSKTEEQKQKNETKEKENKQMQAQEDVIQGCIAMWGGRIITWIL